MTSVNQKVSEINEVQNTVFENLQQYIDWYENLVSEKGRYTVLYALRSTTKSTDLDSVWSTFSCNRFLQNYDVPSLRTLFEKHGISLDRTVNAHFDWQFSESGTIEFEHYNFDDLENLPSSSDEMETYLRENFDLDDLMGEHIDDNHSLNEGYGELLAVDFTYSLPSARFVREVIDELVPKSETTTNPVYQVMSEIALGHAHRVVDDEGSDRITLESETVGVFDIIVRGKEQ